MNLLEHQAKQLLAEAGLPAPRGRVITSPAETEAALAAVAGPPWVLKAQVKAGGRGKAGGVRVVKTAAEAAEVAAGLLGRPLVTAQTGPEGVLVRSLLIEPVAEIARELYLSILVDRSAGAPVVLASAEGGVEIERLAREAPEKLLRLHFDAHAGLRPYQAREAALFLGLAGKTFGEASKVFAALAKFFLDWDCSLVEINPLVVTREGKVVLLDAKIGLDDNALPRQPGLLLMGDAADENPLERQAAEHGLSYIALTGSVGCMVNGAGLAMATLDLLKLHGGYPANFLDVGGGATKDTVVAAFKILLADPKVKAVLVNIFGGIMRCDLIAQGMVEAFKELSPKVPVIVRLEGTNKTEGMRILESSGLALKTAAGFDAAARLAVKAAAGGS